MVERCRNLCGVLSCQLGNGDCAGIGNGFLFAVEYPVCEMGYRHGMAVACVHLGSKIPFLKKWVIRFSETHKAKLENIDSQIALLHRQKKSTFYSALFLEYLARVVSCMEVWLILNVLTTNVSFVVAF